MAWRASRCPSIVVDRTKTLVLEVFAVTLSDGPAYHFSPVDLAISVSVDLPPVLGALLDSFLAIGRPSELSLFLDLSGLHDSKE